MSWHDCAVMPGVNGTPYPDLPPCEDITAALWWNLAFVGLCLLAVFLVAGRQVVRSQDLEEGGDP